jgi:hypothetical protein
VGVLVGLGLLFVLQFAALSLLEHRGMLQ